MSRRSQRPPPSFSIERQIAHIKNSIAELDLKQKRARKQANKDQYSQLIVTLNEQLRKLETDRITPAGG